MTELELKIEEPFYALETLDSRFLFVELDDAIAKFKELLESKAEKSGPEDLKVVRYSKSKQWDIVQLGTPEVYGRAYAPEKWVKAHPQGKEVEEDDNGSG